MVWPSPLAPSTAQRRWGQRAAQASSRVVVWWSTRRRWWSWGWWCGLMTAAVIEALWGVDADGDHRCLRRGGQVRDGQPDFRRGIPLLSHVTADAGRTGRLPMSQPGGGKESVSHAAGTLARYGLQ